MRGGQWIYFIVKDDVVENARPDAHRGVVRKSAEILAGALLGRLKEQSYSHYRAAPGHEVRVGRTGN